MSAIYKNGIAYGGAASAANLISATGGDGTATNVQAELDNINENISSLNNDLAKIGTFTDSGWHSGVSIPSSGAITEIATISLQAGCYVISGQIDSGNATKGDRVYLTYRYSGSSTPSAIYNVSIDSGSSNMSIACVATFSQTATIGIAIRAWSNTTCSGSVRAVRIK